MHMEGHMFCGCYTAQRHHSMRLQAAARPCTGSVHTLAQPFCTTDSATFSCWVPCCRKTEPNSLLPATSTT
jgi:hypothetical protein